MQVFSLQTNFSTWLLTLNPNNIILIAGVFTVERNCICYEGQRVQGRWGTSYRYFRCEGLWYLFFWLKIAHYETSSYMYMYMYMYWIQSFFLKHTTLCIEGIMLDTNWLQKFQELVKFSNWWKFWLFGRTMRWEIGFQQFQNFWQKC